MLLQNCFESWAINVSDAQKYCDLQPQNHLELESSFLAFIIQFDGDFKNRLAAHSNGQCLFYDFVAAGKLFLTFKYFLCFIISLESPRFPR